MKEKLRETLSREEQSLVESFEELVTDMKVELHNRVSKFCSDLTDYEKM